MRETEIEREIDRYVHACAKRKSVSPPTANEQVQERKKWPGVKRVRKKKKKVSVE